MMQGFLPAWFCLAGMLLAAPILQAQETEPVSEEEEIPEVTYSIKTITLSFFGGWTTGATFLDLPSLEDRTFLEEGSNDIWRYDGTIFDLPEYYDAPRKKIEAGQTYGGRIGFYLSDEFHLDIVASVTSSKAVTSFLNRDPRIARPFREQLDSDPGVTSYMGGGELMYDVNDFGFLGLTPYFGVGIGGIINTFTGLEDKSALYFRLTSGFAYNLTEEYELYARFTATTFSFDTEELSYGKQVTLASIMLGASWNIDVTP